MKLIKIGIICILFFILIKLNGNNEHFTNIKKSYTRQNKPLECDNDSVLVNGWCYKKCKSGYSTDNTNCIMDCPTNLKNTNTHCLKQQSTFIGESYNTLDECKSKNINGCYKDGNKYYGVCSSNKKQVGQFCTDKCPEDMLDNGFGCLKTRYIRQIGKVKNDEKCPKEMDRIGDTCYEKCIKGYRPMGSLCISV
jgi:hypothetical protein